MHSASPEVECSFWKFKTLDKAVKLDHLLFEKADVNKTSKRCFVKGIREEYCATPPFALTVTEEEIKRMSNAFREVTRASLFCKALESNSYKPCELFNTSCSRQKRQRLLEECTGNLEQTPEYILVDEIFKNVPSGYCPPADLNNEQLNHATKSVGVTVSAAKEICLSTMQQSKDHRWYAERSKRVMASVFGKIINKRKSLYPKLLIQSITKQHNPAVKAPTPLQWGLDNESKAIMKYEEIPKVDETVRSCGFVVSPKWPWLGCSPDGIVMRNGVPEGCIEIKCTYASKDLCISDAVNCKKNFCLQQTENGLKLKENHPYYFQCQGVLNILNLNWIDFVVYTNVDMHVERIDEDIFFWEEKMPLEITSFYFSFILPSCNELKLEYLTISLEFY